MMNVQLKNGFVLFPVILILAVLGSMAYLLNQQSSVALNQVESITLKEQEMYAAEAGLAIAYQKLKGDVDCSAYSIASDSSFNGYDYNFSILQFSGSPVTFSVDLVLNTDTLNSVSRETAMYNSSNTTELIFSPVKDSHIRSNDKPTNFSTDETMHVSYSWFTPTRVSMIQFDVSSITVGPEAILSASLEMHLVGAGEDNVVKVNLIRLKNEWVEDEVNYNERMSGVAWNAGTDVDLNPAATTSVDEGTIDWVSWDVRDLVVAWVTGTYENHGVDIFGQMFKSNNIEFASSKHSDASLQPRLKVVVQCECGQSCG